MAAVYTARAEWQFAALEAAARAAYLARMDGVPPGDLYDRDFYAWTQDQAARLRALGKRNDGLDVENVAEEIESLGKSDRRAAESLIRKLVLHLLKLRLDPDPLPRRRWQGEVDEFRNQLAKIFRDSPFLRARREEMAAEEWKAMRNLARRRLARDETDVVAARILASEALPFDLDAEVLNEDWFPPPPAA
jgi:hypothetical protein